MQQDKYIKTIGTTQGDLKHCQDFLYRHFKKSENLKLHPITYNGDLHLQHFKSYGKFLQPLSKNQHTISDILNETFSGLTKECRNQC